MTRDRDATDLVRAWLSTEAAKLTDPDLRAGFRHLPAIHHPPAPALVVASVAHPWTRRIARRRRPRGHDITEEHADVRTSSTPGRRLDRGGRPARGQCAQQTGPPAIVVAQDGSGDYRTITEAVAAAADGDTVLVRPGHYVESVTITHDITLKGDGDPATIVLEGDGTKGDTGYPYSIVLSDSDATLSGLTISGQQSEVYLYGGAPTLASLTFVDVGVPWLSTAPCPDKRGCSPGTIQIDRSSRATVRDSEFVRGYGVVVGGASDMLIEGNRFTGGTGIELDEPGNAAVVRDNTITGSGIGLWGPSTVRIEGNTLSDANQVAIILGNGDGKGLDPVITGNTIRGYSQGGVQVSSGAKPTIEGNTLTDDDIGVMLNQSDAIVTGNTFGGQSAGVSIVGGAPTISGNTFDSNKIGILDLQSSTAVISDNTLCGNEVDYKVGLDPAPLPEGNTVCAVAPSATP